MLELSPDKPSNRRRAAFEELRAALAVAPPSLRASGIPEFDALLPAGLPRGAIALLEAGLGAYALAAALIAGEADRVNAIVDDGTLSLESLAASGLALERLLIIPGRGLSTIDLLRAVDAAVRAGLSQMVLLPLASLSASHEAASPSLWARLAALAQRTRTLLIAIGDLQTDPSILAATLAVATLRLACAPVATLWSGRSGPHARLLGYDIRVSVRAYRGDARAIGRSALLRSLVPEPALRFAPIHLCPSA